MRNAFSHQLVSLALKDPKVLLLTGDHGYTLFDTFRKECPTQYINAGIAEQNMVGMAAGLARVGFRPVVYGLAAFIPIRTLEQIKLDIAHDNLPVVFIGDGAGFVYSHLGTSHQSTEDIAASRSIPNLTVLSPADRFEMSACMEYAYNIKAPAYLRMGKSDLGDVHKMPLKHLQEGKIIKLREGLTGQPCLISTGSMVIKAITIADEFDLTVWSAPSIKPLNPENICEALKNYTSVITLEEHSVIGGLGTAIAEIVSANIPMRVLRLGVQDRFSKKCGSYSYLLHEHGLDITHLKKQINDFITPF